MTVIQEMHEFIDKTTKVLRDHAEICGIDLMYWQLARIRVRDCRSKFLGVEHKAPIYKELDGYQSYLERWVFDFADYIEDKN